MEREFYLRLVDSFTDRARVVVPFSDHAEVTDSPANQLKIAESCLDRSEVNDLKS